MSERTDEYWKAWLRAALIRAVRTMAQTAAATIGVATVMSEVDWVAVVSASLLAALLSILTSVGGLPEVDGVQQLELFEDEEVGNA